MTSFHQDSSIEALGLSANARRWLKEVGLRTVLQVAVAWYNGEVQQQWASHPETNVRILADIRERLESYLLRHPDVAKQACTIGASKPSPSASRAHELSHAQPNQSRSPSEVSTAQETGDSSTTEAEPGMSLDALDLSEQSYRVLEEQGIRTIERLTSMSEMDISNVTHLDTTSRVEIRSKLQAFLDSPSCPWTSLKMLSLSARPYNALMRAGFRTVEHLAAKSDWEIWDVPGLGERSFDEIKAKLETYSLKNRDKCLPVAERNSAGVSPMQVEVATSEETAQELPSRIGAIKDEPIENLDLTVRAYNCLKRAGRHTVGQLLFAADEELLAIRQLGHHTLADIREKLLTVVGVDRVCASLPDTEKEASTSLVADQEMEEGVPSSPLESSLEILELSAQSIYALHQAGCNTVADVAALGNEGLFWAMGHGDRIRVVEVKEQLDIFFSAHPSLARPTSLKALDLSVRPQNALLRHKVYTVDRLMQMSEEEIWEVPNIGRKSLEEILEKLRNYLDSHPPESRSMPISENTGSYPPPCLLSALVDATVPEEIQDKGIPLNEIPVERLGLPEWDLAILHTAGVTTVGALTRQPQARWMGKGGIAQNLERYLEWLVRQDQTAWTSEVENEDISPLHRLELSQISLDRLTTKWLKALEHREEQIICWRYGLHAEALTLEEAGESLGITRERVRQIEKKAIKKLRFAYGPRFILPLVAFLRQVVLQAGGLATEARIGDSLAQVVDFDNIIPSGMARLLLSTQPDLVELKRIRAWALSDLPIKLVPEINRRLAKILSAECAPLSEGDLLSRFKSTSWYRARTGDLRDEFILACLQANGAIVCCDEDTYGLEKWERHYQDDIVLALRRLGQPTHYSGIASTVNEALPPERQISARAVHSRLTQNRELFAWVGLRGTYGLKEWGLEPVLGYEDALAKILEASGHPLTYQQILARVPEFRPYYEETSIVLTLGTNERFRSFPGDTYGLTEWREEDFTENYRTQWLFDEVEAVPSTTKPKSTVVDTLDGVDDFIAGARERADHER